MGKNSKISWTHHTFNPWWGCSKISQGCKNCYAESLARRFGHDLWGEHRPRRLFEINHWREPIQWNRDAEKANERHRVFAGSMCDVFEDYEFDGYRVLDNERARLFSAIRFTPWLDWLLVTKRPENIARMLPADWSVQKYFNVWLIATVENQAMADARIPALLSVPAVVHGLSCEPLLENIDISKPDTMSFCHYSGKLEVGDCGHPECRGRTYAECLDWVIVGGESGRGYRPMDLDWARSLRDQSVYANTRFFFKQSGGLKPGTNPLLDGVEYHEFPNPFPQK